jgi:BirA family biotin operon repressor/biotin-[acetyl-CoA-carboxylase] ligase
VDEAWPTAVPGTRFDRIRHLPAVDSTNDLVAEAARHGEAEGLVVAADYQRRGRGRLGRRWEAPPGANLLVSVLLRPRLGWSELHWATAAVALAASEAVRTVAGVALVGKWPNDLLSPRGEKVAGVLAEAVGGTDAPSPAAVVVGLGLNVAWPTTSEALPEDLRGRVSSLVALAGHRPSRPELLQALLFGLEGWLVALAEQDGRRRLRSAYEAWCATLGQEVRVDLGHESLVGRAEAVDEQGALVVALGDGSQRVVAAGDVQHLRAVPLMPGEPRRAEDSRRRSGVS